MPTRIIFLVFCSLGWIWACAQQQTAPDTSHSNTEAMAPKHHWVRTSANPDQMATAIGQGIGQIAVAAAHGCSLLNESHPQMGQSDHFVAEIKQTR